MAESKLKSSIMKNLDSLQASQKSTAETMKATAKIVKALESRMKALEEKMEEYNEESEEEEVVAPVVEEEKAKEEARSEIEGEEPASDQPADPGPEDNNDKDVYKSMAKRLERIEKAVSGSSSTPRTGAPAQTNKSEVFNPADMITSGKKMKMSEVHKAARNGWR